MLKERVLLTLMVVGIGRRGLSLTEVVGGAYAGSAIVVRSVN